MCLGILDAWLGIFQIGFSSACMAEILAQILGLNYLNFEEKVKILEKS